MAPLSRLPVFLALEGKRAIVAGGTPAAAWKAELLSAAGATVDIYAADASEELAAVAAAVPRGPIALHARTWAPADCAGAAVAIGAFDDDAEAARFAAAARAAGVPVNVIDKPAFCDFVFGAIVNRSPLVIAVSTDGAAPVFAQAIRTKLEALIPRGFARWAEAARRWRPRVQALDASRDCRQHFWEKFAARAFLHPDREPADSEFERVLADTDGEHEGCVTTIDVGSGDPGLLTLRSLRMLQSADIIFFDRRVGADVLDFARREARKLLIGGNGDPTSLMVLLAKSGRRVVRLTCGEAAGVSIPKFAETRGTL